MSFIKFRLVHRGVVVGSGVICSWSTNFWRKPGTVFIGNRVWIGGDCYFQAPVQIGNNVLVASRAAFINSVDHRWDQVGKAMMDSGRGDIHKIVIEDDVWVGFGATIIAPAHVCRGSIIGAGSVVRGMVEPYSIVAGVPAKLIRYRFSPDEIIRHEEIIRKENLKAKDAIA